jgi:hypothetical protein
VGFMVDRVALGQVSLRVLPFTPVYIIPLGLHTYISSRGKTIGPIVSGYSSETSVSPSA